MRSKKELLTLLRDYIVKQDSDRFFGMCAEVREMHVRGVITEKEYRLLEEYLKTNKPIEIVRVIYWWPAGVKAPRIDWLDKQIKELEESTTSKIGDFFKNSGLYFILAILLVLAALRIITYLN